MTITKSIIALLIVLLSQSNIFTHNYLSILETMVELHYKKNIKNIANSEHENHEKKTLTEKLGKQAVARIKYSKQPSLGKNLSDDYLEDEQVLIKKIQIYAKVEEVEKFNFSSIKSTWFGCCGTKIV